MSVGKKIKSLRRRTELTQKELGEMVRLSRSHIAAIEADAYNPSLVTLQRIAEVLRVPVSDLVDEKVLIEDGNLALSDEKMRLLTGFDELNVEYRQRLLGYLDCLLQLSRDNTPPNRC